MRCCSAGRHQHTGKRVSAHPLQQLCVVVASGVDGSDQAVQFRAQNKRCPAHLGIVLHAAALPGVRLQRRLRLKLHLVLEGDRPVQRQQAAALGPGAVRGLLRGRDSRDPSQTKFVSSCFVERPQLKLERLLHSAGLAVGRSSSLAAAISAACCITRAKGSRSALIGRSNCVPRPKTS